MNHFLKITLFCLSLLSAHTFADEPHPHQGVLSPFPETVPAISLTQDEISQLNQGEYLIKQFESDSQGGGFIVQDINAPIDTVWNRILSFSKYPDWVNHVERCEPYERSGNHLKVEFVIGAIGIEYQYFIDHIIDQPNRYIRWTLDYSRLSEIDDVVGFWYLQPNENNPEKTRLYYSVEIKLSGWIPGFIQEIFSRNGLIDAATWVKRVSEPEKETTTAPPPVAPILMMPVSD